MSTSDGEQLGRDRPDPPRTASAATPASSAAGRITKTIGVGLGGRRGRLRHLPQPGPARTLRHVPTGTTAGAPRHVTAGAGPAGSAVPSNLGPPNLRRPTPQPAAGAGRQRIELSRATAARPLEPRPRRRVYRYPAGPPGRAGGYRPPGRGRGHADPRPRARPGGPGGQPLPPRLRDQRACSRGRRPTGAPWRSPPTCSTPSTVALRAAALTDGAVDPTVGARPVPPRLRPRLRRRSPAAWTAPSRAGAGARLAVGGVRLRRTRTVAMPPGTVLDLGATAKAWAADRAAAAIADRLGCGDPGRRSAATSRSPIGAAPAGFAIGHGRRLRRPGRPRRTVVASILGRAGHLGRRASALDCSGATRSTTWSTRPPGCPVDPLAHGDGGRRHLRGRQHRLHRGHGHGDVGA